MRVTIDHNSIISLEEKDSDGAYIEKLIAFQSKQTIELCVAAISGAERQKNGGFSEDFTDFTSRLNKIGLGNVNILPSLAICGLAFLDNCLLSDEPMAELEKQIHKTLFPSLEYDFEDYRSKRNIIISDIGLERKWRNAKCDVENLWCHIHHKGDIYVTNDLNFHKLTKKSKLISLGANLILTPKEAICYLESRQ